MRLDLPDQPFQKRRVLGFARLAEKVLAKVEIGGMQQTHAEWFPGRTRTPGARSM